MPEWFDAPDPTGQTDTGELGLRFGCTQCGNCCSGPSGYVLFTPGEAHAIARHLGVTPQHFHDEYTFDSKAGRSLREIKVSKEHGYDCVFLERDPEAGTAGCSIYPVRPVQCRTWPFWPENLTSKTAWKRATKTCPGLNRGRLHKPPAIRLTRERVEM